MNSSEQFKHYTEKVCEQIRWKKAHGMVAKEIENHLIDQKNAYMDMGDSESTAEEKALLQMGDPVSVGAALDSTHKPAPQWGMICFILFLFGAGLFFQLQYVPYLPDEHLQEVFFQRVSVTSFLGIAALLLFYFLDFSFWGKYQNYFSCAFLGIILLTQFFGTSVNGQHWFFLGGLTINPYHFSIMFPLVFAGNLYALRSKGKIGYIKGCALALFWCVALSVFSSFGSIMIFLFSAGTLLFVAAFRTWFGENTKPVIMILALLGICCVIALIVISPYRVQHIVYTFHPEADPNGHGYVALVLRDLLDHSVLLGHGTGSAEANINSFLTYYGFPSDYFLTFVTYKHGWIVSIGLVTLLTLFLALGFRKCLKQKSVLGQMISLSILSVFAVESVFYVLSNLGYPLISSASLPFLSYGMNSACLHLALAGILLSTFRTGEVYQDTVKPVLNERKLIQWDDGKLIISFK